jgi:hypothetical protein
MLKQILSFDVKRILNWDVGAAIKRSSRSAGRLQSNSDLLRSRDGDDVDRHGNVRECVARDREGARSAS